MRILLFAIMFFIFSGVVVYSDDLYAIKNSDSAEVSYANIDLLPHGFNLLDTYDPTLYMYDDLGLNKFLKDDSTVKSELNGSETKNGPKSTVILGGIVPFVSIQKEEDNEDQPGFFSKDGFSFFWYLKKKF